MNINEISEEENWKKFSHEFRKNYDENQYISLKQQLENVTFPSDVWDEIYNDLANTYKNDKVRLQELKIAFFSCLEQKTDEPFAILNQILEKNLKIDLHEKLKTYINTTSAQNYEAFKEIHKIFDNPTAVSTNSCSYLEICMWYTILKHKNNSVKNKNFDIFKEEISNQIHEKLFCYSKDVVVEEEEAKYERLAINKIISNVKKEISESKNYGTNRSLIKETKEKLKYCNKFIELYESYSNGNQNMVPPLVFIFKPTNIEYDYEELEKFNTIVEALKKVNNNKEELEAKDKTTFDSFFKQYIITRSEIIYREKWESVENEIIKNYFNVVDEMINETMIGKILDNFIITYYGDITKIQNEKNDKLSEIKDKMSTAQQSHEEKISFLKELVPTSKKILDYKTLSFEQIVRDIGAKIEPVEERKNLFVNVQCILDNDIELQSTNGVSNLPRVQNVKIDRKKDLSNKYIPYEVEKEVIFMQIFFAIKENNLKEETYNFLVNYSPSIGEIYKSREDENRTNPTTIWKKILQENIEKNPLVDPNGNHSIIANIEFLFDLEKQFLTKEIGPNAQHSMFKLEHIFNDPILQELHHFKEETNKNKEKFPSELYEKILQQIKHLDSVKQNERNDDFHKQFQQLKARVRYPLKNKSSNDIDFHKAKTKIREQLLDLEPQTNEILGQLLVDNCSSHKTPKPLCLVGPSGTGKSQLVNVIGDVFKKPVLTILTPSIKDISELFGHDYTYSGSTAGKIYDFAIQHNTWDFIIKFDECEKGTKEIQGALLQLADGKDNGYDNPYLQTFIDSSPFTIIATINDEDRLIGPLKSRFTMIPFEPHSDDKKEEIFFSLLTKSLENINIKIELEISKEAIKDAVIFANQTDSEGVRILQQFVDKIVKKIVIQNNENNKSKFIICSKTINYFLSDATDTDNNQMLNENTKVVKQKPHFKFKDNLLVTNSFENEQLPKLLWNKAASLNGEKLKTFSFINQIDKVYIDNVGRKDIIQNTRDIIKELYSLTDQYNQILETSGFKTKELEFIEMDEKFSDSFIQLTHLIQIGLQNGNFNSFINMTKDNTEIPYYVNLKKFVPLAEHIIFTQHLHIISSKTFTATNSTSFGSHKDFAWNTTSTSNNSSTYGPNFSTSETKSSSSGNNNSKTTNSGVSSYKENISEETIKECIIKTLNSMDSTKKKQYCNSHIFKNWQELPRKEDEANLIIDHCTLQYRFINHIIINNKCPIISFTRYIKNILKETNRIITSKLYSFEVKNRAFQLQDSIKKMLERYESENLSLFGQLNNWTKTVATSCISRKWKKAEKTNAIENQKFAINFQDMIKLYKTQVLFNQEPNSPSNQKLSNEKIDWSSENFCRPSTSSPTSSCANPWLVDNVKNHTNHPEYSTFASTNKNWLSGEKITKINALNPSVETFFEIKPDVTNHSKSYITGSVR